VHDMQILWLRQRPTILHLVSAVAANAVSDSRAICGSQGTVGRAAMLCWRDLNTRQWFISG
jgi:hypothetical protein